MVPMPKLWFVASAALDGQLILWDTITYKKVRVYREHQRGITSLAFNESTILLFSAGFDHWIGVWNPLTSSIIYKITGHSGPIVAIKVVDAR
jgi:WD40 repeat protein